MALITLDDFLFHKREVLERLRILPHSKGRTVLLELLKIKNHDLLLAVVDTWIENRVGSRPFATSHKIPSRLMPKVLSNQELFQYVTNKLKRSID
jgi:hypothetical protein